MCYVDPNAFPSAAGCKFTLRSSGIPRPSLLHAHPVRPNLSPSSRKAVLCALAFAGVRSQVCHMVVFLATLGNLLQDRESEGDRCTVIRKEANHLDLIPRMSCIDRKKRERVDRWGGWPCPREKGVLRESCGQQRIL